MSKYDVFFYEAFAEEEQALRQVLPATFNAGFTALTIQEYAGGQQPPAAVLSTRTQSVLPLHWGNAVEAVLTRSTGYDHLLAWQQQSGSPAVCGYLPLYCARAVGEQAALLWLALLRRLPRQLRQFRNFERDNLTGIEALGKTLVIVGVGNIGKHIADIGRGLGMKVIGVDLVQRHADIDYAPAASALAQADVVVCAMNLTAANHGYFDEARLRQLPKGSIFVNIARGELSPIPPLLHLIEQQHLGGVGLDVYDNESRLAVALRSSGGGTDAGADSELVAPVLALAAHDNVLLTPHNAFNTHDAVQRKSAQSIEQLEHLRATGTFKWVI